MVKKLLALVCALAVILSFGAVAFASSEASGEASGEASAETVSEPVDRPNPEFVEGERYVSDTLEGASAVYVSGGETTIDDAYFYGAGTATSQQISDQIPNQYGYASVVLAVGKDTVLNLNNPTIESDPESYANGIFAAGMSKVVVNGGSITTNNRSGNGHGVDVTYMGHVYLYDTVVYTGGGSSGGLASDFGGGFIQGERVEVTTDHSGSPAIFCAGTTIVVLKDSKLTANNEHGVIVAHDHSVVALENCEVNAAESAVSGLQALPSPESSEGSTFFAYGSTLHAETGAVINETGGRTVVNLIDTECQSDAGKAISCTSGILTVNLWGTELSGSINCSNGCTLVVNVYEGGKLTGEVTGDVEINVYDGGEYVGSYAVNAAGAGEEAPAPASFDEYLVEYWGVGSLTWTAAKGQTYVETYEPVVIANSAASYVVEGAALAEYDSNYDPSENGIDVSLIGGAHGFTEAEVFGGAESRTGVSGSASGEASSASGEASN